MSIDSSVLSENEYFPLCLQNGVDSMLIGPLGSLDGGWEYSDVLTRLSSIGWYKTDRRESPMQSELVELANLYTRPCIGDDDIVIEDFEQSFDAKKAILTTKYWQNDNRGQGRLKVRVTTFLTADHLLVEHYEILELPTQPVSWKFGIGPAVQFQAARGSGTGYKDPIVSWRLFEDISHNGVGFEYSTSNWFGIGATWVDCNDIRINKGWGQSQNFADGRAPITFQTCPISEKKSFTRYSCLIDNRDSGEQMPQKTLAKVQEKVRQAGYEKIRAGHECYWNDLNAKSAVSIAGRPDIQYTYEFSNYYLASSQDPASGFTPVGLQPYLWSGYQFWDQSFPQYAWSGSGRFELGERLCRQLISHHDKAKKLAAILGYDGATMAWRQGINDFEVWPEKGHQWHVSSVAAYSLWHHYQVTGNNALLADTYDLMNDLVTFSVNCFVQDMGDYAVIAECMGLDESKLDLKVNDSWTCAITIRAIEGLVQASETLDKIPSLTKLPELALKLRKGLERNIDEKGILQSFEGGTIPHWGSLIFAHIHNHCSAIPTIERLFENYCPKLKVYNTHAVTRYAEKSFPWTDFWCARILAMEGDERAGELIANQIRFANCFGGLAERIFYRGQLFKQYFVTGQAAFSWAVQGCLVNQVENKLRLFYGINKDWGEVSFENLYTDYGLMVSAQGDYNTVRKLVIASRYDGLEIEIACRDTSIPQKVTLKKGENIIL